MPKPFKLLEEKMSPKSRALAQKKAQKMLLRKNQKTPKRKLDIGSSFDDFLAQEDLLAEANAVAIKRVLAFKLQQEMDKKGITKSEMAKRMHISRAALSRFLDPENISITLATMEKAAIAMGKKLEVKLVRA